MLHALLKLPTHTACLMEAELRCGHDDENERLYLDQKALEREQEVRPTEL